jgi:hypothetical protein
MSHRRLIKLIDRQAKVQEDLQDDCSMEGNDLPSEARQQRRELEYKGDLHNTFANALREISAEGESEEDVVAALKGLSTDLLAHSNAPSFDASEDPVKRALIAGFLATITAILAQGAGGDPVGTLPKHLVAELESLSEDHSVEVLNLLKAKHEWAGSLATGYEIREELETVLPVVTEESVAAVKATDQWQRRIGDEALEVTQAGVASAVTEILR